MLLGRFGPTSKLICLFFDLETYSIASETRFYWISRWTCSKRSTTSSTTTKQMSSQISHSLHISGPGIHPIGSWTYFSSILVLKIWQIISYGLESFPQTESHRIEMFDGHSVQKVLGSFLTESLKVDVVTILDAHWPLLLSDSMDSLDSVDKWSGNCLT